MQYDLEYRDCGLFTRFMPNTPAGEDAWREMAKENGNAAVLSLHANNVIAQLRKAGYSVGKAKKPIQSIDEILEELEGFESLLLKQYDATATKRS